MSWQLLPVEGVSDSDYERRAVLVGELAQQVQDYSPHEVWEYLTALPGVELQRLLMVSLAAIPLDRSLNDMYRWVVDLPIAQGVAV